MEGIKAAQLTPVDAGPLIDLSRQGSTWQFTFKNKLVVESYSGWRLLAHDFEGKTLLGSRDLSDLQEPFKEIDEFLNGFELKVLNFDSLSDRTQLQFMDEGNIERITLDIHSSSSKYANWKIIGEDFEDTDIDGLIKNL